MTEANSQGRESQTKELLLSLLSDGTVVIASVETGVQLIRYELDFSQFDEDD